VIAIARESYGKPRKSEMASSTVERIVRRLFLLVFALAALTGCGSDDGDDSAAPAGSSSGQVVINETEFALDPSKPSVDAAGRTTIQVVNDGSLTHALEVEGNGVEEETEDIAPGQSAELTVELGEGEYEIYCPLEDHRDQGMEGTLVVGSGAAGGTGTDTGKTDTDEDGGYGG
jgi:plastocyanin